uniref:hypothetical protein n=1 Tax=Amycolatopsis sp. CA-096443 TaxID=3239919 RepID=UPI003F492366
MLVRDRGDRRPGDRRPGDRRPGDRRPGDRAAATAPRTLATSRARPGLSASETCA